MVFSEIAWPIKLKFYVELPWVVAFKFCWRYLGHMTKMAALPIYEPCKNLWADFNKIQYVALGTQAHHNLIK